MRKIESLQGLRGWAILMIVLWHLNSIFPRTLPKLGDRGVEFFLFISGFLIARKCQRPGMLESFRDSASYTLKKIKESYWLYFLPAVPVFLLDVFAGPEKIEAPLLQLASFSSLLQSWIPDPRVCWAVSRTAWFFPVILYCYLITPLIRKAFRRFSAGTILLFCLFLQVASELLAKHFLPVFYYEWLNYVCPAYRALDFTIGFCAWHLFIKPCGKEKQSSRASPQKTVFFADFLYVVLVLVLTGLSLLRPVWLKYVLFHPFEIALLIIIASEKSVIANILNRNRVMVRLGDLSRIIFFTHLPVIRLTGIIWRRFFNPDLFFPLWLVSLLMILLSAVITDKLIKKFQKAYQ